MRLKVSNVDRKNNYIRLSIYSPFGMRSIFHNLCSTYFSPNELIDQDIDLFSPDERELIYACQGYNMAIDRFNNGYQVESSVYFDGNVQVQINLCKKKNEVLFFEFDECKFTELMKRYISKKEIRKMLHNLFTFHSELQSA